MFTHQFYAAAMSYGDNELFTSKEIPGKPGCNGSYSYYIITVNGCAYTVYSDQSI